MFRRIFLFSLLFLPKTLFGKEYEFIEPNINNDLNLEKYLGIKFKLSNGRMAQGKTIIRRGYRRVLIYTEVPLNLPKNRVSASMSANASSYIGQLNHTVWHMTSQSRISSKEARYLLTGLNYNEVDAVHECYHTNNNIRQLCLKQLREWKNVP